LGAVISTFLNHSFLSCVLALCSRLLLISEVDLLLGLRCDLLITANGRLFFLLGDLWHLRLIGVLAELLKAALQFRILLEVLELQEEKISVAPILEIGVGAGLSGDIDIRDLHCDESVGL
jgi:hypothetical protein